MFNSFKKIFFSDKKKVNVTADFVKIDLSGKEIIELIRRTAKNVYKKDQVFPQAFLLKIITLDNPSLEKDINKFIKDSNNLFFHKRQQIQLIEYYLVTIDSFFKQILIVWEAYLEQHLTMKKGIYQNFKRQIALFTELIIEIFNQLHRNETTNPEQPSQQNQKLFRIKILQIVTDSYKFKHFCHTFNVKMENGKGMGGNLSISEISQTKIQLQELLKFREIPAPFNQSISLLIEFYHEYRIINKVKLLVKFVDKVKEQIATYRAFFKMKNGAFGSDQIMAIVNFITETSGKNIYASTQYIKAILSGPITANQLYLRDNLLLIDENSDYCFHLLEAVSTVHCHISQLLI